MNMTQIAPTTRAEINERLRDAIQRPNGARWCPSWPGAVNPWASRASGHPARRQRARHNCFPPASPSVAGRLSLEGFEGIYTDVQYAREGFGFLVK